MSFVKWLSPRKVGRCIIDGNLAAIEVKKNKNKKNKKK
jgi:hypothetical protein